MGGDSGRDKVRRKPSGILKLDSGARRRESSGSSLLQLGDEFSPPSSVSPQLSVTWAFPPVGHPQHEGQPKEEDGDDDDEGQELSNEDQHPATVGQRAYRDGSSKGSSNSFAAAGRAPPPADDRKRPVNASRGERAFSERMKSSDAAFFTAGEHPTDHPPGTDDEEDYSASINAIIQRKASVKKKGGYKGHRRASSPLSAMVGAAGNGTADGRRRSSVYTSSSGETWPATLPGDEHESAGKQDKLFDTIRLHKEVLQTVKLQPISMKRKLRLVQQAKSYITRHEGALQEHFTSRTARSLVAQFNIFLTTKWQQLLRELANLVTYLVPWESRIKEIESHFGSVVASYFTFLRWLFSVNVVISVLLVVFIMVPEEIYVDPEKARCDIRKSMSAQERALTRNFSTIWEFEGHLKYSPLFYGYYSTFSGAFAWGYNLPLAYFFTGLVVYIYSFVATLKKMAENSRMSKLSSKDDEYVFSWKLFTGWDYMIGHMETAQNRMASIILGFKEALLEEAEKKKDTRNWKIILLRILVNFLILGLLVISAYEVIEVVKRSMDIKDSDSWWRRNEITVVMSLISFFFPMVFEALGIMEYYHPRKQLRIQLARIMVLNMLNLYSLIFALFDKIAHMTGELRKLKPLNFSSSANRCFMPPEGGARWNGSTGGGGGADGLPPLERAFVLEMVAVASFNRSEHGSALMAANGSSCVQVPVNCSDDGGLSSTATLLTALLLTNLSTTAIPELPAPATTLSTTSVDFTTASTLNPLTTTADYRASPEDGTDYDYSDYEGYQRHRASLLPNDNLEGVPINKREAVFGDPDRLTTSRATGDEHTTTLALSPSSTGQVFGTEEFQTMTYTEVYRYVTGRYDTFLESYYYSSEEGDATGDGREVTDPDEEAEYEANQFLSSEEAHSGGFTRPTTSEHARLLEQTTTELDPGHGEQSTVHEQTTTTDGQSSPNPVTEHQYTTDSPPSSTQPFEELTTQPERTPEYIPRLTSESPVGAGWTTETETEPTNGNPNLCYRWVCTPPVPGPHWDGQDGKYRNADLRSLCWETMFGQELAKLTVMDLIVTIVSTLIMDIIRALFVRFMNGCWCWDLEKKFPKYGDFKIAENILHLVNNQGMVWMGMFFSPGLAVLNIAKLVIILYLRSWTVLTCNVPHEVVFRASRSNNFYFALLLTMLFLCVLPVSYAIVFLEPSWHCGPFSNSNRIYHLLTNATERIVPEMVTRYIVSPAAIIPLLVLLVLIIYYLLSLTGSLREANADLKLQLRKERTEERRKMFKIASSTQQQQTAAAAGGAQLTGINGLSSSWHKVLDSTQLRLQSTTSEHATSDSEHSGSRRKELLQRMMRKALQKEGDAHGAEGDGRTLSAAPPLLVSPPVMGTVNERQRRPGAQGRANARGQEAADVFRFDRQTVDRISQRPERPTDGDGDGDGGAPDGPGEADAGGKKFERTRPSTADRLRSAAHAERGRRGLQSKGHGNAALNRSTADWIERIPVITISKTSSDECIIDSDLEDPSNAGGPEEPAAARKDPAERSS